MFKHTLVGTVLLATIIGFVPSAWARDEALLLSIQDVLDSDEAREKLDGSVKFSFAHSAGGAVVKSDVVSNRKTNAFGKSDELACQRAMLSALIAFQDTAKNLNAKRVNNIVSFYKKKVYSSSTKYECHAGGFIAGVALRGDVAR